MRLSRRTPISVLIRPARRRVYERWKFAQKEVSEELALLHHFSIKKNQKDGDIDFLVTVKEFAAPPKGQYARFFRPSGQIRQSKDGADPANRLGKLPPRRALCLRSNDSPISLRRRNDARSQKRARGLTDFPAMECH